MKWFGKKRAQPVATLPLPAAVLLVEKETRLKAFETLFHGSVMFELNMNDTFAFATADCETITPEDFEAIINIVAKYGHAALTAYVAVKRNDEPIECKCNWKSPAYYAAKKEIEEIKKNDKWFMME